VIFRQRSADASARAGGDPVTRDDCYGAKPDAGEELRHAAATALHEASRVSELLADLVTYATGPARRLDPGH
jgi:hypothetical protein